MLKESEFQGGEEEQAEKSAQREEAGERTKSLCRKTCKVLVIT